MSRTVITYGTFDLFHIGHLRLLTRLRALGDKLIVGVSTDEFNASKGKKSIIRFEDRIEIVRNLKCVDLAVPEAGWDQKALDIKKYDVSVFGMGNDWEGKFDELREFCEVVYLPRTQDISSTQIRETLAVVDRGHVEELKKALDIISTIVDQFN
ncbi:MAG: adenylyltransferase/cytidyltransferase family protein [Janthinobacterium lividum]